MATFAETVEMMKEMSSAFEIIISKKLIEVRNENGKDFLAINWAKAVFESEHIQQMLSYVNSTPTMKAGIDILLEGNFIINGPKIFEPTYEQCLILEQVELNFPISELKQPFPVMAVVFPKEYIEKRTVSGVEFGNKNVTHGPNGVIMGFMSEESHFLTVLMNSSTNVNFSMCKSLAGNIEDYIDVGYADDSDNPVNEDEDFVCGCARRIAINSMMLMCENGFIDQGVKNPSHYNRLKRYVEVAKKTKDKNKIKIAEDNLKLIPMHYSLDQNIKIHEIRNKSESDGETGVHNRTHWRRGHWRNHKHGPKLSMSKRIFIKPILVNAESVVNANFSTTYRI